MPSETISAVSVAASVQPRPQRTRNRERRLDHRPRIEGKFLYVGAEKLLVRGVTYGPFNPERAEAGDVAEQQHRPPTDEPCEYGTPESVAADFQAMVEAGVNTVRVYTVPPRWLLDIAAECGLYVMIGLPWEQHITFLDRAQTRRSIEQRVREGVEACAEHPAVLAFAVGNEIPASIVRWYGRRRIEAFLKRLYKVVKRVDPDALATYVNFPTTEYLQLDFLDFACFNVYLENREVLRKYLSRLQNLAGDKPLVMGEVGLDSLRNGHEKQAEVLDWQIRETFASGAAGMFVFAWTDEWHRGGHDIEDWDFGLTTRDRLIKPALDAVSLAYDQTPFPDDMQWPMMSIVVCTYNGGKTLGETLAGCTALSYPNYEVVVVIDGSSDNSRSIALQYEGVRVIEVENGGLSRARNIGMRAAAGEIICYIDDDAYPDPHWLHYLAWSYMNSDCVAMGGPNLSPKRDGWIAQCVTHSPGGPNHVLLSDTVAEHIPGCNLSVRKAALEAIGGFDEQFRIAGDDVDVCWRLQDAGGKIGFHPTALVWHHRRASVKGYLKQQRNYGKAEAMLERKWPAKYNHFGHVPWQGRIYGSGVPLPLFLRRSRVYHGVWGGHLFQSIYMRPAGLLRSMPLMPEWHLLIAVLVLLAIPGLFWRPMLFLAPLAAAAVIVPLLQAGLSAVTVKLGGGRPARLRRWRCRALIGALHVLQPMMRLQGRIGFGLTPWRRPQSTRRFTAPRPRNHAIWSETWRDPLDRLRGLQQALHRFGARMVCGGAFDRWDLEIRGGMFGGVRLVMAVEEHGGGRQLVRLRAWPVIGRWTTAVVLVCAALAAVSLMFGAYGVSLMLGGFVLAMVIRLLLDCGSAMAAYFDAVEGAPDNRARAAAEVRKDDGVEPRIVVAPAAQ